MPNFKNSKIYKIVNNDNDKFYVGSTTQSLHNRFNDHKSTQSCSSVEVGDLKQCSIILIEAFECDNRQEMLKKEREYFDKYKAEGANIVNKKKPISYTGERKEQQHKWYQSIYQEKRTVLLKKTKEYYDKNKDKLKVKITCECGCQITKYNMVKHKKSKKHLNLINT
tara:strand:- start:1956 stop:2456 length:501 start_codon:yes stop_codon:yes gene_type:complete